MTTEVAFRRVLQAYPPDCQPAQAEYLAGAGGFSGASFWRLKTPRGTLCLRCWPREHPSRERLEFIQAVLWHVHQEGFRRLPLPLETRTHAGYVCEAGHLWELTPWCPGVADYLRKPCPAKLQAALVALAQFHHAAASFPLPNSSPEVSPGIAERFERLQSWSAGRLDELNAAIGPRDWPELEFRAREWLELVRAAIARVQPNLAKNVSLAAPLQPCIRDIWHDHVLYLGDEVSAFVDFGAMRPDSVAAYQRIRPLSDCEATLVGVFDQANTVLAGLNWLEWIYVEGRQFENRQAVVERLDWNLPRLATLAS
jgi:hypothetical protein